MNNSNKIYNFKNMSVMKIKMQTGFSLLEVFIALTIGLVIFAGVLSVFVGMRTTTNETSNYGELQENGRFAISILSDDLLRQDFWGDYTGSLESLATTAPAAPVGECRGDGINNGTFPLSVGHFRTLWGETADTNTILFGCRTDAKIDSDILQIKRVVSTPLALNAGDVATAGNYYLVANSNDGAILSGGDVIPDIDNSQVWEYQHHIYYVTDEVQGGNNVPVLMQGQLANTLNFAPIIDGIEMIRFEYGVDMQTDPTLPGYGVVDAYIPAATMTSALWNNATSRIISVKIYVLARSINEDASYENKNTYQLAGFNYAVDDNYRRLLFSSTITLYNAKTDIW